MADRDVTVDIVARDKTAGGVRSVNRNLKSVEKSWKDVDGQGKRTLAAAQKIAGDWGRGLSKVTNATSRWAHSGDGAGKKFVRGIGSGLSNLADLGGSIGGGLSKAVSAAGPYVQVAMAALLVGAVAAASPAIAGAIVGGAAGAGIVGGLMLAAKDARVSGAFDSLKRDVSTQLTDAAESFVPAALSAVREARSAFSGMLPDLRRLFSASSGFVAPLTRSIGKGTANMLHGITNAVEKARPIIDVVGKGVEMIGQRVGEAFDDLKDNGAGMAAGLHIVFTLIAGSIQQAGWALNLLVESFEFFVTKIPGGKKWLDGFKGSSDSAKGSADTLGGGFRLLGGDANTAASGIANLKEKTDEFVDSNIGLREAQLGSKDATAQANKVLKENGKVHGDNTAKGRENEHQLLSLAEAFNRETDAGDRSGLSANKAGEAYANNRQKLIAMAEKAGYSKTQAEKLAAQLLKIPKNVNTDVNVDTQTGMTRLETLQKKIRDTKGKTVTITVQVLSNGNHRMPGGGQLTKDYASYNSWQGTSTDSGQTSRTGGPRHTEMSLTNNVYLDGQLLYSTVDRKIAASERRQKWRQKVGRR